MDGGYFTPISSKTQVEHYHGKNIHTQFVLKDLKADVELLLTDIRTAGCP